jgi:hypothetical protein
LNVKKEKKKNTKELKKRKKLAPTEIPTYNLLIKKLRA